jgi:hypothetical protein
LPQLKLAPGLAFDGVTFVQVPTGVDVGEGVGVEVAVGVSVVALAALDGPETFPAASYALTV